MPFAPTMPEEITLSEAQDLLQEAAVYAYGVRRKMRATGYVKSETDELDARSAIDFIHELDPVVNGLELAGHRSVKAPGGHPDAATLGLYENPGSQSMGSLVSANDNYLEGRGGYGATHSEIELAGSVFANNASDWRDQNESKIRALIDTGQVDGTPGDAGFFMPVGQPVAPRIRQQRLFLRDLMSVVGTSLGSIPYIREYNPTAFELGASAVVEGTSKPEVNLVFENDDAVVKKIAAWVPATTEILDDAPTLRGYIDTRLAYMLAIREERDLLFADGTNGRIKGITQFTGVQPASGSDTPVVVATAIGLIENVDGDANGVVLNPIRYWTMVSTRNANQFDQGFGTGAPYDAAEGTLWGLPVIRTRSFAPLDGMVGSFNMGATLFDRMRTVIRVGNQHSTYFVDNKVAILAEERVALAVHRPDFFVRLTLS